VLRSGFFPENPQRCADLAATRRPVFERGVSGLSRQEVGLEDSLEDLLGSVLAELNWMAKLAAERDGGAGWSRA